MRGPATPSDIPAARTATTKIIALDGSSVTHAQRPIAVEVPVQILYGGIAFAVMMLTPADLIDFAYGFSLTEGIIEAASDIRDVEQTSDANGLQLRIGLVGDRLRDHFARQRAMTGRTGCGVCGIDDPAALNRAKPLAASTAPAVRVAAIARALAAFEGSQELNTATRAVHGAAFARADGSLVFVREDVGRHNALDKLVGAIATGRNDAGAGFIIVTSRCSYEMVHKTAAAGIGLIAAVSAPTGLAIDWANSAGVTLAAFARGERFTIYAGDGRIVA